MTGLARRYAKALYESTSDRQAVHKSAECLMSEAELWQWLKSPAASPAEREAVIRRLPWGKDEEVLMHFFCLVARKGRMGLLPQILQAFDELERSGRGAALCRMRCARRPDEKQQQRLCEALAELHHKKEVELEIKEDPKLLGGFILEIDGVTYDKSVRGRLDGLARQLQQAR